MAIRSHGTEDARKPGFSLRGGSAVNLDSVADGKEAKWSTEVRQEKYVTLGDEG